MNDGAIKAEAIPKVPEIREMKKLLCYDEYGLATNSHTKWNCAFHIVMIPKCRRRTMYGEVRNDVRDVLKKLCEMHGVVLIDDGVCSDHVHMYVAIPPKPSLSEFMSCPI